MLCNTRKSQNVWCLGLQVMTLSLAHRALPMKRLFHRQNLSEGESSTNKTMERRAFFLFFVGHNGFFTFRIGFSEIKKGLNEVLRRRWLQQHCSVVVVEHVYFFSLCSIHDGTNLFLFLFFHNTSSYNSSLIDT